MSLEMVAVGSWQRRQEDAGKPRIPSATVFVFGSIGWASEAGLAYVLDPRCFPLLLLVGLLASHNSLVGLRVVNVRKHEKGGSGVNRPGFFFLPPKECFPPPATRIDADRVRAKCLEFLFSIFYFFYINPLARSKISAQLAWPQPVKF